MLSKENKEGIQAYLEGKSLQDAPYDVFLGGSHNRYSRWQTGFFDAEAVINDHFDFDEEVKEYIETLNIKFDITKLKRTEKLSNLKIALLIIKNTSQKDYQEFYDMVKNKYLDESVDLSAYSIEELIKELDQLQITLEIKQVVGISVSHQGSEMQLFPHAEYGWDGGSPIMTEEFNLKTLDTNDFGGGPTASIITLKNPNYPGFALHYGPEEYLGEIHIFM
jgi:hypothetical protein